MTQYYEASEGVVAALRGRRGNMGMQRHDTCHLLFLI